MTSRSPPIGLSPQSSAWKSTAEFCNFRWGVGRTAAGSRCTYILLTTVHTTLCTEIFRGRTSRRQQAVFGDSCYRRVPLTPVVLARERHVGTAVASPRYTAVFSILCRLDYMTGTGTANVRCSLVYTAVGKRQQQVSSSGQMGQNIVMTRGGAIQTSS